MCIRDRYNTRKARESPIPQAKNRPVFFGRRRISPFFVAGGASGHGTEPGTRPLQGWKLPSRPDGKRDFGIPCEFPQDAGELFFIPLFPRPCGRRRRNGWKPSRPDDPSGGWRPPYMRFPAKCRAGGSRRQKTASPDPRRRLRYCTGRSHHLFVGELHGTVQDLSLIHI